MTQGTHTTSSATVGGWEALSPTCARRAVLSRSVRGYMLHTEYRSTEAGRTVVRRLGEVYYRRYADAMAALAARKEQVAAGALR